MSASGNQAAETSKDTDGRIVDRPWNIIPIRLPPRKRLSDGSLILSKKALRGTYDTRSKKVTELTVDNPDKNLITAAVQSEASSNSPRVELCNETNSNTLSKMLSAEADTDTSGDKLPEKANESTISENLRVTAGEQGNDASRLGLCEEDNNNIPSMPLPLPVKELSEEPIENTLSKNLIAAREKRSDASSHPPKQALCEEDNNNIPSMPLPLPVKELSEEHIENTLSKNLIAAGEKGSDASSHPPKQGLREEANNNILSMALLPVKELPEEPIRNTPSKNVETTGVKGEEENNYSPRKKLLYDVDSNIPSKVTYEEAKNPTTTGLKCEDELEQPNDSIPTKKLSDEAKDNAPSNRPIYSDNKKTPHKKLHTSKVQGTGTSQNTSEVELSTSVGQAVDQSINAANFGVIKEYQEFEKKVKRTVYLDNVPHQPTEAKNNPSRDLTTTDLRCEVLEQASNPIATKKLSDEVKNNALSYRAKRPTDPAKKNTPRKKLCDEAKNNTLSNKANRPTDPAKKNNPCKKVRTSAVQATGTSQNTSGITHSTSVNQAVEQSTPCTNLEAMKEYQEFEEKVKRTVYLDNLSHLATEAVIKSALNQFGTLTKVSFVVNYTIPYDIPQSALVEMETEKDAEAVVNMLHEFPFMISGMPRPARAKRAMAEMFNDRPCRPGIKLEFCWVSPTDPDYEILKQLKLTSRKHEVENLALIEHELEEEKLLAEKQQENLSCNYRMLETMGTAIMSGMSNHLSHVYSVNLDDVI